MILMYRFPTQSFVLNSLFVASLAAMPPCFVAAPPPMIPIVDKQVPPAPHSGRHMIPKYVEEIRYNPLRFYTRHRCAECPFRARFRVHYETHVLDLCEDHYNILDIIITSDQLPSLLSEEIS